VPAVAALMLLFALRSSLFAQSRLWSPDERTLVTDLSGVTAIAASSSTIFAATRTALALYDRAILDWRATIGLLDGFPPGGVLVMVASPAEDVVWMGGAGRWFVYEPFVHRLGGGTLPGTATDVVVDAEDPGAGAWFRVGSGWYQVARGGLSAEPATSVPPPNRRVGPLSLQDVLRRVPAFDVVRMRVEQDAMLRRRRVSAAAEAPVTRELYVATDGNGAFRLDPLVVSTDRLPAGIVGAVVGALGSERGTVCAGTDARVASARRGVTCFDESLRWFDETESLRGGVPLPGMRTRRILVTRRSVWAATDAGLLRIPRGRGGTALLRSADGLPTDDVRAVAEGEGGVWVGTATGLAFVPDSGRAPRAERTIPSSPVLSLAWVADTLWVGTAGGLAILPPLGAELLEVSGMPQMREPIVALAVRADTLVALLPSRFLIRSGGAWRLAEPAGASIGRFTAMAGDAAGLWVAGTLGFASYDPRRNIWTAITSPADVPLPVADIAVTRDHVWVATAIGVVRYLRRMLEP
jgi:hypothetical protein